MADSYSYYSLPVIDKVIPAYLIVYSIVMPPVVSAIVNTLVINKRLSRTALSLIRNEQKTGRTGNINLGSMKYLNRFRVRQMLKERRTAFTVAFGMFICLVILMLGLDCYVLCDRIGRLNSLDTHYEYMYTYKYPTDEVPEGGEPCFMTSLKKEKDGYSLDITVIGIDDDNPVGQVGQRRRHDQGTHPVCAGHAGIMGCLSPMALPPHHLPSYSRTDGVLRLVVSGYLRNEPCPTQPRPRLCRMGTVAVWLSAVAALFAEGALRLVF